MKLSPLLGLPIAEPDDFATNFPVEVDDPRTTALDQYLHWSTVPGILVDPGVGSQAAGTNVLKGGTPTAQGGWLYNTSTGVHTAPESGFYSLSAWVEATSASSGWLLQFVVGTETRNGTTVPQAGYANSASLAHIMFIGAGGTFTMQLVAYSAALTVSGSRLQVVRV